MQMHRWLFLAAALLALTSRDAGAQDEEAPLTLLAGLVLAHLLGNRAATVALALLRHSSASRLGCIAPESTETMVKS